MVRALCHFPNVENQIVTPSSHYFKKKKKKIPKVQAFLDLQCLDQVVSKTPAANFILKNTSTLFATSNLKLYNTFFQYFHLKSPVNMYLSCFIKLSKVFFSSYWVCWVTISKVAILAPMQRAMYHRGRPCGGYGDIGERGCSPG